MEETMVQIGAMGLIKDIDKFDTVVSQEPFDLPGDHWHRVGGESNVKGRIEFIDGFDQANASYLKQILRLHSALSALCASARKALHHMVNQPCIFSE